MDYIRHANFKTFVDYQSFKEQQSEDPSSRVILLTTKSKRNYLDFRFRKNDRLLLGRESAGVPENVHKIIKNRLKIPMKNDKRSLNISSSVAIILAESLKQIKLI